MKAPVGDLETRIVSYNKYGVHTNYEMSNLHTVQAVSTTCAVGDLQPFPLNRFKQSTTQTVDDHAHNTGAPRSIIDAE